MSGVEVRVDVRATTEIERRSGHMAGAYLDIGEDVTITFGDAWRSDWRPSALTAIDNLAEALDLLRRDVAEGMQRATEPEPVWTGAVPIGDRIGGRS